MELDVGQDLVSDGCQWTGSEGRNLEAGEVDKDVNHPAGDDKKKSSGTFCPMRSQDGAALHSPEAFF